MKIKIELIYSAEGFVTNGMWLYKGKPSEEAEYKNYDSRWTKENPLSEESCLSQLQVITKPAKFQHYAVDDPQSGKGISTRPIPIGGLSAEGIPRIVFKSAGRYYTYNQEYFVFLKSRIPKDIFWGISKTNGQLVAYIDSKQKEPVAALMPQPIGKEISTKEPPVEI